MTKEELNKIVSVTTTDLGIENGNSLQIAALENLRIWLAKELEHFLNHDFNRLVNALYRMDISEQKAKSIFNGTNTSEISEKLADLIIEREYQKVITRERYKNE
jgi:hypothetical protein